MVSGEALKKLQEQIAEFNGLPVDRLRELAEADKDGRAITLPCKLGGEVWAPGCGRTVKLRVVEAALLLQGEDGEGYEKLSDFGKTFFATKEGAEEAKRNEWFT